MSPVENASAFGSSPSEEPFVSADEAAHFLCVKRRYLLELARRGITGAYALGTGSKRKIWVFRLSELAASIVRSETPIPKPPKPCTIGSGSPRRKTGVMAYQRGSLKKVRRKEGETWVLRYRVTNPDGRRVENVTPIGLVR